MEQRAAIRFLKFKGIRAFAMPAEFRLVYETEAFAISTVKNWRKRFAEGRTSLCNDPMCGRSLINDLAEAIPSMSKESPYLPCKVLCRHFRIAKGTCLRIVL
jgi:hypothetical protein